MSMYLFHVRHTHAHLLNLNGIHPESPNSAGIVVVDTQKISQCSCLYLFKINFFQPNTRNTIRHDRFYVTCEYYIERIIVVFWYQTCTPIIFWPLRLPWLQQRCHFQGIILVGDTSTFWSIILVGDISAFQSIILVWDTLAFWGKGAARLNLGGHESSHDWHWLTTFQCYMAIYVGVTQRSAPNT